MRPTIRLRGSILVAISIVATFVPCTRLIGQPPARKVSAQSITPVRVPQSPRRNDPRIAYIEALLDSAPGELAQSGNVLRAFGFAASDTSAALRGMSIAVIDTTGARTALLLGDGATIDALPLQARRALATAGELRGRGSPNAAADGSTATLRVQMRPETQTLAFVKPIPRAAARCDCLLDGVGAIVAALSPSGSSSLLTAGGMLAGTALSTIALPSPPRSDDPASENRQRPALGDLNPGIYPPFIVLALLVVGVGCVLVWRGAGFATRSIVRREQLVQTIFNANDLISELASEASTRMGDSTRLETHFDIAPAVVRGDRRCLARALRRIIRAANRAMPRGGTLTLVTRFAEIDDDGSRDRPTVAVGHYVVVSVEDTGRPMPEGRRRRLLEPTDTESRKRLGSFDDLTLVTSIVHAHGWRLHCSDRRGDGNLIEIYIPLAPESIMPLIEWQGQLA